MGRRFAKDIRCNRLILKIVNTYTPLIEYGAVIWNQNRVAHSEKLEKILHNATRFALQTPFRPDAIGYTSFDKRLMLCKMQTYAERREIADAIFIIKIMKGKIDTNLHELIMNSRYESNFYIRSPPIFAIRRNLTDSSPLHRCMITINKHRELIQIEQAIETTKQKLKTLFNFERSLRNI